MLIRTKLLIKSEVYTELVKLSLCPTIKLLYMLFSCPILLSSLPFYGGGLTLSGSLLILAYLQSSLLLSGKLSLVADIVIGCRVVNVVLRKRVYDAIQLS